MGSSKLRPVVRGRVRNGKWCTHEFGYGTATQPRAKLHHLREARSDRQMLQDEMHERLSSWMRCQRWLCLLQE